MLGKVKHIQEEKRSKGIMVGKALYYVKKFPPSIWTVLIIRIRKENDN